MLLLDIILAATEVGLIYALFRKAEQILSMEVPPNEQPIKPPDSPFGKFLPFPEGQNITWTIPQTIPRPSTPVNPWQYQEDLTIVNGDYSWTPMMSTQQLGADTLVMVTSWKIRPARVMQDEWTDVQVNDPRMQGNISYTNGTFRMLGLLPVYYAQYPRT